MGGIWSLFLPSKILLVKKEMLPSKPTWSIDQIPDLAGKVAIVTGANTGLGYECSRVLVSRGATVYVAARSQEKGLAAVDRINIELAGSQGAGKAVFLKLSLDDCSSIKAAVEEFNSKEDKLHILMNNAGVMTPSGDPKTSRGLDLQFATNVFGPFVLTRLLLPTLMHTAKNSNEGTVRVVNVSSSAHGMAPRGGIRFDDLSGGSITARYCQSKMGDLVFAKELARRYPDSGIISVAVSPGNIETALWKHQTTFFTLNTPISLLKHPVSRGILTQLYAATSPDITKADSGGYFQPWARKGRPMRDEADDLALGEKLWEWCEQQMKEEGITA